MTTQTPRFVMLKSINGEPLLVNLSEVRTVSSINLAGDEVGVISFDKTHEVVIGSTVQDFLAAIAEAPVPVGA
jgi:hypothetical protein